MWRFQRTAKQARMESCCWRRDSHRKASRGSVSSWRGLSGMTNQTNAFRQFACGSPPFPAIAEQRRDGEDRRGRVIGGPTIIGGIMELIGVVALTVPVLSACA